MPRLRSESRSAGPADRRTCSSVQLRRLFAPKVAGEKVERAGPGVLGGRLVVHRRGVPVGEGVAGVVAVKLDIGAPGHGAFDLVDLLGGDERVPVAVVE